MFRDFPAMPCLPLSSSAIQPALAALLLFQTGAVYALGIFNPPIEAISPALTGAWAASMALIGLVATPCTLLSGVFLSAAPSLDAKVLRTRALIATAASAFAALSLGAVAVDQESVALIRCTVAAQGVVFGFLYLIGVELLAAWKPANPGLAVGSGQMLFGLGSIAFSSTADRLLSIFPVTTVLPISALLLSLPVALVVPFVRWPKHAETSPSPSAEQATEPEPDALLSPNLTPRQLPRLPTFWFFVIAVFTLQAGFAFVPFFFRIGRTYGHSRADLVGYFDVAMLVSTLLRPVAGVLADRFRFGDGPFGMASKNLMTMLLVLQLLLFSVLVPLSSSANFIGYFLAAAALISIFAASACGIAILGRDVFGKRNSSLVYGMGGATAMGFGEFAAGQLIATVDLADEFGTTPDKYLPYYVIGIVMSSVGLLCCLRIRKYDLRESLLDIEAGLPEQKELTSRLRVVKYEPISSINYGAARVLVEEQCLCKS